jgi:hypothetical protein
VLVAEDASTSPDHQFGASDLLNDPLGQRSPDYQCGRILRLGVDESIASYVPSALALPR